MTRDKAIVVSRLERDLMILLADATVQARRWQEAGLAVSERVAGRLLACRILLEQAAFDAADTTMSAAKELGDAIPF